MCLKIQTVGDGRVDSQATGTYKTARFQIADHELKCVSHNRMREVQLLNTLHSVCTPEYISLIMNTRVLEEKRTQEVPQNKTDDARL